MAAQALPRLQSHWLSTKVKRGTRLGSALDVGIAITPLAAVVITITLLAAFTEGILQLQNALGTSQSLATLFLIPVAFAGALLGVRGGCVAALCALLIERVVLNGGVHDFTSLDDSVRFVILTLCMFIVASVTGYLRTILKDLNKVNRSLVESEERRLSFNREVLLAVTSGRLILCDDAEIHELAADVPLLSMALTVPRDVGEFRCHLREAVLIRDMPNIRLDELEVCATEAATNAIKHGNGGTAEIRISDNDVSLLISDHGTGISPSDLARATLERGFSTRVSLGMGFTMMLETADKLALSTSPSGTTIFVQCLNKPKVEPEDTLLERYAPFESWLEENAMDVPDLMAAVR